MKKTTKINITILLVLTIISGTATSILAKDETQKTSGIDCISGIETTGITGVNDGLIITDDDIILEEDIESEKDASKNNPSGTKK